MSEYLYSMHLPQVAQMVKRLPAMQETQVQSLAWEDPLEKEMATHSHTLAWKIPWTEEPVRLQSRGLQRVGHNWAASLAALGELIDQQRANTSWNHSSELRPFPQITRKKRHFVLRDGQQRADSSKAKGMPGGAQCWEKIPHNAVVHARLEGLLRVTATYKYFQTG